MATTPNYGWVTPAPTDFVTDLPADFETFADAVDDTVKDLNPGTTAGDIDYYTSSTAKARLAIGTAGQVLKVNSGATAPEWGTAAAGGYTQLATGTLSGASVVVSSLATTYRDLVIVVRNFRTGFDGDRLRVRFNGDSGTNYSAKTNDLYGANLATNANRILILGEAAADDTTNGGAIYGIIHDYGNTAAWKTIFGWASATRADDNTFTQFGGGWQVWRDTAAVNSITFFAENAATMTAGTYFIYGVS